jgi:leader peptidase (prepilin peptidase) / N-methyltransferase
VPLLAGNEGSMHISHAHIAGVLIAPLIGSFLSVLVVRLPSSAPVVVGRSRCQSCGHVLAPVDLVPILSGLWLGGRCRHCQDRISSLYLILELSAVVTALWAATELDGALYWLTCVLGWALLALAATDLRDMMLPDALTLPLIATGLVVGAAFDENGLTDHLIGAAVGFLVFYGVGMLYRRIRRRDGLGLGDAKLIAAAGAWVTWAGLPSVVLIGAGAALVAIATMRVAGRSLRADDPVPFGVFLAVGFWLVWLYGPLTL